MGGQIGIVLVQLIMMIIFESLWCRVCQATLVETLVECCGPQCSSRQDISNRRYGRFGGIARYVFIQTILIELKIFKAISKVDLLRFVWSGQLRKLL